MSQSTSTPGTIALLLRLGLTTLRLTLLALISSIATSFANDGDPAHPIIPPAGDAGFAVVSALELALADLEQQLTAPLPGEVVHVLQVKTDSPLSLIPGLSVSLPLPMKTSSSPPVIPTSIGVTPIICTPVFVISLWVFISPETTPLESSDLLRLQCFRPAAHFRYFDPWIPCG